MSHVRGRQGDSAYSACPCWRTRDRVIGLGGVCSHWAMVQVPLDSEELLNDVYACALVVQPFGEHGKPGWQWASQSELTA